MKLIHFSNQAVKLFYDASWRQQPTAFKPYGLWVSDEDDYGWRKWVADNDYEWATLKYKYEVELKPAANILFICNKSELRLFTDKYKAKSKLNSDLDDMPFFGKTVTDIDWPHVARDYQGIIITPYLWECRLDFHSQWYYGWDCASGCIWSSDAIAGGLGREIKNLARRIRK